jgi:hypothetical protein
VLYVAATTDELGRELIHYRCTTSDHQTGVSGRSGMTIYNGRWAYCPAGGVTSAHRWTETGGVRFVDLRTADEEYDNTMLSVLSAAETLFGDLNRAIGVTTLRLEVARVRSPLCVDVGERWSLLGRALFEVELRDSGGHVGRVLVGDDRRDDYHAGELELARKITQPHVALLRRWLSAQVVR